MTMTKSSTISQPCNNNRSIEGTVNMSLSSSSWCCSSSTLNGMNRTTNIPPSSSSSSLSSFCSSSSSTTKTTTTSTATTSTTTSATSSSLASLAIQQRKQQHQQQQQPEKPVLSSSSSSSSYLSLERMITNKVITLFSIIIIITLSLFINNIVNNAQQDDDDDNTTLLLHRDPYKVWFQQFLRQMTTIQYIAFIIVVLVFMEIFAYISCHVGKWMDASLIPVRGKHLDELSIYDWIGIVFAKVNVALLSIAYYKYSIKKDNILIDPKLITFSNTVIVFGMFFVVYDFFYTILHRILHIPIIYQYIHKIHHKQLAPSRGNIDLYIIHPLEIFLVQYNYWFTLYIMSTYIFSEMHFLPAFVFLLTSGMLDDLSHTRYDISFKIPVPTSLVLWLNNTKNNDNMNNNNNKSLSYITIYDTKSHDVHHRIPMSNYGLNIMLWDVLLFDSYRPYNPNERINPKMQLDPKTGKTIQNWNIEKSQ